MSASWRALSRCAMYWIRTGSAQRIGINHKAFTQPEFGAPCGAAVRGRGKVAVDTKPQGLKPSLICGAYAALKAPLFYGTAGLREFFGAVALPEPTRSDTDPHD